jgi:hypothetical protein
LVEANSETLNNSSVPGPSVTAGLWEISGTATVDSTVPAGYNALVVEAPGADTISGDGAANFLAVFGNNSSVNFNTDGGSGTVYASGNDTLGVSGSAWSIVGGTVGGVAINVDSASTFVTLQGSSTAAGGFSNVVGSYSQNLNVLAAGSNDFIITGTQPTVSTDTVSVTGFTTILNEGANDTVYASGSGSFVGAFGSSGGKFFFINDSSAASSIIGGVDPTTGLISSPGSVTVEGGTGGGVFDGGTNGSNSLVGGSGMVTLFAAGTNNYLFANGSGSGYNLLNAASGSGDTLVGGSSSSNNVFFAGTGTESIVSFGTGAQTYFVGTLGSETIQASTVTGASNSFIFDQAASQGGGTDVIKDFVPGVSQGVINLNDGISGVTINDIVSLSGAASGTQIGLSDGTTIKLLGVNVSDFSQSLVGGTKF